MLCRTISLLLIFLMINLGLANAASISAQTDVSSEKQAQRLAKIKRGIKKLGTGEDAKIKVKLHDKTRIKGYVEATGEDDFTVVEKNTGSTRTIDYTEVRSVSGKNIPLGVKIAIGVGIAILASIIIFEIVFHTVIDN